MHSLTYTGAWGERADVIIVAFLLQFNVSQDCVNGSVANELYFFLPVL